MVDQPIVLEGGGLRVVFSRELSPGGDRFGHTIEGIQRDRPSLLIRSIEGTSDDLWPPSPPLQEVHSEQFDSGQRVILAVGRAGSSHWSLSCQLDAAAGAIHFDVACRIKSPPPTAPGKVFPASPLGSTYRAALPPVRDDRRTVQWELGDSQICLRVIGEEIEPHRLESQVEQRDPIACCESGVHIQAQPSGPEIPATVRWKYSIGKE